jgi:mutator protein MutT
VGHIVNAVFVRDGRVLLAKRSAHRRNYANLWSFPGGNVEAGETLEQALMREVGEETAARPIRFEKIASIIDQSDESTVFYLYAVTDWTGDESRLIGSEHSEVRWLTIAEARGLADLALHDYHRIFDYLEHRAKV